MGRREDLLRRESEGWEELNAILDAVPPERMIQPGVNADGWSIRDVMWHVAYWCADTERAFARMREGKFDAADEPDGPEEVDPINDAQLERSRSLPLEEVRAGWHRARAAMLERFGELEELTPEAVTWFAETGELHYAEHLPEVRAWIAKLG